MKASNSLERRDNRGFNMMAGETTDAQVDVKAVLRLTALTLLDGRCLAFSHIDWYVFSVYPDSRSR